MNTSGSDGNVAADPADRRMITATIESPFTIHLWEDRTRGEQWVPAYDTTELSLLADDFLCIASNNAVENGQRTFEFKAVKPGVHQLVFEKRMGWKFTAEDRRVFEIDVMDGSRK